WRSFRGIPNLITSPGCIWPGRPIASSTCFQLLAEPLAGAELAVCAAKDPQYRQAIARVVEIRTDRFRRTMPCIITFSLFFKLRNLAEHRTRPAGPFRTGRPQQQRL